MRSASEQHVSRVLLWSLDHGLLREMTHTSTLTHMVRVSKLSCFLGSIHFAAVVVSAQPAVVRGDATCRTCTIEREVIVRIGEGDDELINGPVHTPVVRDTRGRFFVIDQDDGPVKVFASDGKFLTLLGREGGGPGEFKWAATTAIGAGDSVLVTDRRLMRASVFGPDLKFVRSFPLTVTGINMHSQIVGGLLVVNAQVNDAAGIGFPLFAFNAAGMRVKLVGPEEPQMVASETWRTERVMGHLRSGKGGLLVAHRNRYQWWRLSSSLDTEAEFAREASWFRGYSPPLRRNQDATWADGVTYLKAIWEDATERIWVAIGTIHVVARRDGKTERTESSRVEVLDLRNRTVVASATFPERFVSSFSDGTVVFSEVRTDGRTVLSVTRLSLRP